MDTERKPGKKIRYTLYRLGVLIVLAIITVIVANVLANAFGI